MLTYAERRGAWPSAADLAEHARLSRWTFRDDLRVLADAGFVSLEGRGQYRVWRITEAGFEALGVVPFAPRYGGRPPSRVSWERKAVRRLRKRLAAAKLGGSEPEIETVGD